MKLSSLLNYVYSFQHIVFFPDVSPYKDEIKLLIEIYARNANLFSDIPFHDIYT